MTHSPARNVVADFIDRVDRAISGADADPYALMADDVTVLVSGTTPLSGHYPGLEIVKHVLVNTAWHKLTGGRVRLIDAVAEENRVGALLEIIAETRSGKTYNEARDPAGCVFSVSEDKINFINLFPDTTLIETVIFDHKFVPNQPQSGDG